MTVTYRNISGSTISCPEVSEYDLEPDATVDVVDDVVMSTDYFAVVE